MMESFHGPKSLFINDDNESMLVVIPRDEFDNPSPSSIDFKSIKEGKLQYEKVSHTSNLVSYTTFPSPQKKTKQILSASRGQTSIREQQLIAKSGIPKEIEIKLIEHFPFADGRQYFQLSSNPIVDDNGELVEDGTLINYLAKDKKDNTLLQQYKLSLIHI